MNRRLPEAAHHSLLPHPVPGASSELAERREPPEFWFIRVGFVAGASVTAGVFRPGGLSALAAAVAGAVLGIVLLLTELGLKAAKPGEVLGAAFGVLTGSLIALFAAAAVSLAGFAAPGRSLATVVFLLCFGYLGLVTGARLGHEIPSDALRNLFGRRAVPVEPNVPTKLLDTSVLIDGRIADICEAHFLDGPLLVPQFVLHELQVIADSSETLRRQRGRRGLEVLQRIQKMPRLEVRILDDSAADHSEVDHQLVELARRLRAKIVTNDFNLNKVASVQGIGVLNVNELANALRPAVLPGESMRVFVLREGKEAGQGVAYLEDGTMVVVDGARRLINKTVDILVTSVHQTPAGKMIFGRLEDRTDGRRAAPRQAPTAARAVSPSAEEASPDSDLPKSGLQ